VNVNEMEMTLVGWTCEHRKLVERANEWLQQNMGVCEVLTIGQLSLASLLGRGCGVCEVLAIGQLSLASLVGRGCGVCEVLTIGQLSLASLVGRDCSVCEMLTMGQLSLASLLGRGCDVCEVLTCETVTWCAVNPQSLGDSEQMALSTSIERGSKTFYLRGLR